MSTMIHQVPGVYEADPLCGGGGGGEFQLVVRQHPECAKVAIGKEKADRKPVDPPPILQLKCTSDQSQHFLQSPYFFCSCALAPEADNTPIPVSNSIVGTLVSSLHKLKDSDNTDGGFFVFGDLSIKQEGRFRLQFDLFELRDGDCIHRTTVRSDVFTVHSPKNFPGMAESTFLTRSFSDQGVRLRLRKDSRALTTRKRTSTQADLNQMMPQKRYYEESDIQSVKRRKYSPGPSPHHSIPSTPYGARSAPGPYPVDAQVAVTQGLMNSPVSYSSQAPVLPRPNQSPGSYSQSPQSYGVPVQVTLGPETTQTYTHPISAQEMSHSQRYAIAPIETTQSYSLTPLQTSDPQPPPPAYHPIHTAESTSSYQSQTPLSTQLPSLDYALPTHDTPQDSSIPRTDAPIGRVPASESLVSSGSISTMAPWQQQPVGHHPPAPTQAPPPPPTSVPHVSPQVSTAPPLAYSAGSYARNAAQS